MAAFCFSCSPKHIPLFLIYLNQQHPNINFTFETDSNSFLPFLDIQITLHNGSFLTSINHKPSFTGLFANLQSFNSFSFKRGLILSLLHRFSNVCLNFENSYKELEVFKKIFRLNGYPTHHFYSCVCDFWDKVFSAKLLVHTALKKVLYFCLPLIGIHSPQIRKYISSVFSSAFLHLNIRFIFRSTRCISHILTSKDWDPKGLRSRVLYSFTSQCCTALYVSPAARHLHSRASDHLRVSSLTGKKSVTATPSSSLAHLSETLHTASFDDFKILSSCSSSSKLLVRESHLISKDKPCLNSNLSSIPMFLF